MWKQTGDSNDPSNNRNTYKGITPSLDEQAMLVDIILNRLKQQRKTQLLEEVAQAEREYDCGNVRRGSVADLMAELDD